MQEVRYFVHFKGGLYKLIGIGRHSETLEEMVIYQAMYGVHDFWVRPKSLFFSKVVIDGKEINRFKEITKEEMLCRLQKKNEDI